MGGPAECGRSTPPNDPLERLTCPYFSLNESSGAPCALKYGYAANGNLTLKSDVGLLSYGNPAHPHAVTKAGNDSFRYDAVGNQTTRPGGTTVAYTPFDLPKEVKQGASTITFGYDGDQQRIRKSTPDEGTLYFGDLYERVTQDLRPHDPTILDDRSDRTRRLTSAYALNDRPSLNSAGRDGRKYAWTSALCPRIDGPDYRDAVCCLGGATGLFERFVTFV